MILELSPGQKSAQKAINSFMVRKVAPFADKYDKKRRIPGTLIHSMAQKGYLGSTQPEENSGNSYDMITFGLLCEETGKASASLLSLLTVHSMVLHAIDRWGTQKQKQDWLSRLTTGEILGAFGLSEPDIGSDAKNIDTSAKKTKGHYTINGEKKWISCGQIADLFLIIAQYNDMPTAFLVEKDCPGFTVKPIKGLLGFRSAMLAELKFDECIIPAENMIGQPGFGFSHIAGTSLDVGRYCIAWGSVGIAQACVEACIRYTNNRKQFGSLLIDHQMIQQMLADMITDTKAARLLCLKAGYLKDRHHPESIIETSTAKYFASKTAVQAAMNSVQIHGANGCSDAYPVQRYFRDAKIMEIIEGSSQMQQILIAKYGI